MAYFDYLFYRFVKLFPRGDDSRAVLALSMMQFALLLPWVLCGLRWVTGPLSSRYPHTLVFGAVMLLWLLGGWANHRRYRNRFEILAKRWPEKKGTTTSLKSVAVVVAFFASIYLSYRIGDALPF